MSFCVVEGINGGKSVYPHQENRIADLVSSLYFTIYGVFMLLFPIIGSALVERIGFRYSLDIIGLVLLINSIVYLLSTIRDWKETEKKKVEVI